MSQLTLDLSVLAQKRQWIQQAYEQAKRLPNAFWFPGRFTSDDLRDEVGDPPVANWMGGLMAKLKTDGLIIERGRVTSTRRSANGRKVGLYGWRKE